MKKLETGSIIDRISNSILRKAQNKQQNELAENIRGEEGLELSQSIIRSNEGRGEPRLRDLLQEDPETPEIVMLLAGATDGMTYIQQTIPSLFSMLARDRKTENEIMKKAIDDILREEGKAGIAEGMLRDARNDVQSALDTPMQRVSNTEYMTNRAKEIQRDLFDGKKCRLIVVRNATKQDVRDATEIGGNQRVVLIHGHGFRSSVEMTDGRISNHELSKPERKLKAIILDTCGGKSYRAEETENMGDGISDTVFGFNRVASPRDLFAKPLQKKILPKRK